MKKKKGMRLVAMIEQIKSKDEEKTEKYEVINFLTDIKVKHTYGKKFKIEKNPDYIKIPYAEGIDDLTVIVGENGVGKTRLVSDILSMSTDKGFIFYDVDNNKYRFYAQTNSDSQDENETADTDNEANNSVTSFFQMEISPKNRVQKYKDIRRIPMNIVKFSNSIELSSIGRELNISKDISTSNLLKESELHYVNLNDMKKQIGFLNGAIVNKFEILRFITSKKIIINKDDSLKYYKTSLDIGNILAPRNLSGINDDSRYPIADRYSQKKQLLQNLYDVLIYINIKVGEVGEAVTLEKPTEKDRHKFNLIAKAGQWQEIPPCYNLKKILGVKDWDDFLSQWDKDKRIQTAWAEANVYLDYFKHPDNSPLDKEKRKRRLGRDIYSEAVINDFLSLERIGEKYRKKLVSLVKKIERIEEPTDQKTVSESETFDEFYEKYYSILNEVEEIKSVKFEQTTINSYISPFYKLCIDKLLSTITFSWDGLSSGELALLNLFGRLYSIKKDLKANNILLLLDEVDLGLHPEWQRRWISVALPIIQEIFKGKHIQIIMTTHSPIMLSDIYADNVIMLRKDNNGKRVIAENQYMEKNQVITFGQNIHDLYRDSFYLESTRGEYAKEQIQKTIEVLYELEVWQDEESKVHDIFREECKNVLTGAGIKDKEAVVWLLHCLQIDEDIENIKKISNEEEYVNHFYEKYYKKKARNNDKFTNKFQEKFAVDKQIIDKLKSDDIIFPKFDKAAYKDKYKTQYREEYIKLRDSILNTSILSRELQELSENVRFKQILKHRIDTIGELLIRRKLLAIFDNVQFSEFLSEFPSESSEVDRLLQKLKEVSANNGQVLLKVSEIEELMHSHNGEE